MSGWWVCQRAILLRIAAGRRAWYNGGMVNVLQPPPLNRRELAYYLLFGSLGLAGLLVVGLLVWFVMPQPEFVALGEVSEFVPGDQPYRVYAGDKALWVVNLGGELRVYDGVTPSRICRYIWVSVNNRFEDPCCGSKFTLAGEYISGPATRNLDQYTPIIRDSLLTINLLEPVAGAPREAYVAMSPR